MLNTESSNAGYSVSGTCMTILEPRDNSLEDVIFRGYIQLVESAQTNRLLAEHCGWSQILDNLLTLKNEWDENSM